LELHPDVTFIVGKNGSANRHEPEAALSPSRQLAVLRRIHYLVQNNSQFIIATHSPILMAYPGARIILLGRNDFSDVRYEETEHYAVTKKFLNNYADMIKDLFED
jgi:predicted ATPase